MTIRRIAACGLYAAVAYSVATFPVYRAPLAVCAVGVFALILKRPTAWAAILPAALPAVDLTPLSGRFFVDEFDIIVWTTIASLLWVWTKSPQAPRSNRVVISLAVGLGISYLVSAGTTLFSASLADYEWFGSYRSPYNSIRVAKAFFYAAFFWGILQRRPQDHPLIWRHFLTGTAVGLAILQFNVLLERVRFTGLWGFDSVFRASGGFSTMHTGGASFDGYLILAIPLCASLMSRARRPLAIIGVLLLILGAAYAVIVTVSRSTIVIAAMQCLLLIAASAVGRISLERRMLRMGGAVASAALIGAAVWNAPFVWERFSGSLADWPVRVKHWQEVLAAREPTRIAQIFGDGAGSFPAHFAKHYPESASADYRIQHDGDNCVLRLQGGVAIFFGQRVRVEPHTKYQLSFDRRRVAGSEPLYVILGETSLMYSSRVLEQAVDRVEPPRVWTNISLPIDTGDIGSDTGIALGRLTRRPVTIAFCENGWAIDEIDSVKLVDAAGHDLIANGGFDAGHDHWFFNADDHLKWHVKNLYLYILYEQGAFGLAMFGGLSGAALAYSLRAWRQGAYDGLAVALGLFGVLALGIIDSVFDAPRITLLYYLMAGFALFLRFRGPERPDEVRVDVGLDRRFGSALAGQVTLSALPAIVCCRRVNSTR